MEGAAANRKIKMTIISVVILIAIKLFVPEVYGLTPAGVSALASFVAVIFLWLTCGTDWPSYVGIVMVVCTMAMNGGPAFQYFWGNTICAVIIPMCIVTNKMSDLGATRYIARWFLSMRVVKGRPYVFWIIVCIVIYVLSFGVYAPVIALLMAQILREICLSIGYERDTPFYKVTMCVSMWAVCAADTALPFGKAGATAALSLFESLGLDCTAMDWMYLATVIWTVVCVLGLLTIKLFMRPDTSHFVHYDVDAIRTDLKANPLSKAGKFTIITLICIIFCWIFPYCAFMPDWFTAYFKGITNIAPCALAVCLMCVVKFNGKSMININEEMGRVSWSMVLFLGTVLYYSAYLACDEWGIKAALTAIISPLANTLPVALIAAFAGLLSISMSQFTSNTVSGTIMNAVFVPTLLVMGVSPGYCIATGICTMMLAHVAYLTPASCIGAGITYTFFERKGTVRYSMIIMAGTWIVCSVVLIPIFSKLL